MDGYQPSPPPSGEPGPRLPGPPPLAAPKRRPAGPITRFRAALQLQSTVISAIMLREIHTRFGRHNLGYLWLFFEPMILAFCIASVHKLSGHGMPGGIDPMAFYIVGYTPYYLFRSILNRAASALQANAPLFYHRQVTFLDVLIARNLLDTAAVMVALMVMLLGMGAVTGVWPDDLVWMAIGVMLMAAFCHGVALMIVAATAWGVENVERVVHPLTYLMIPLTGAFIAVWWFPTELQEIALLNPTIHMFEMIREAQFGPVVPHYYSLSYAICSVAIVNAVGLVALRAGRRHIELI